MHADCRETNPAVLISAMMSDMRRRRIRKPIPVFWMIAVLAVILTAIFVQRSPTDPDQYSHYVRRLSYEEIAPCSDSPLKTYMDYRTITDETSDQYSYIREYMKIDRKTGLLYDADGFLGVALGYSFGSIGTRFYFVLDTGIILPVVKVEEKDPADAPDGCRVELNGSVLEFVIDAERAGAYFGVASNGMVLQGNFNNDSRFEGSIQEIDRVTE